MIEISEKDFDVNDIIQNLTGSGTGAVVAFVGTVRDFNEIPAGEGKLRRVEVKRLQYECYEDMAREKMSEIAEYAKANFDIIDMHMVHRTGELKPSEKIVVIAASAAHRKDAFRACEYAIDELKKSVPVWKKEFTTEKEHWVGMEESFASEVKRK
ncbi:MAG: molybdenum cofactor biosynthesis protein MoaE [Thermoplasmata archaeon]|nr:MAG: molybdenum cofactor biosynthesis protein MoaE [Thermoplasmata archaeon]